MLRFTESEKASFWSKVNVTGPDECWNWTRSTNGVGYGKLKLQGRYWLAHRLAYTILVADPGTMLLCHKCDNRGCVNPSHMFIGRHKDNTSDCIRKGRFAVGNKVTGSYLTEQDILNIRALYVPRKFGRYKIARTLGLSPIAIGGVINGNNWSWVR